mgnify:CR=1 FL=1
MNKFSNEDLILITGASSGIGKAAVEKLINEGAKVVGVARREDKLKEIANKYSNFNYEVFDISKIDKISELVKNIVAKYGKLSGFVHCAGIQNIQPISLWNYKDAIEDFKVNVFSAIELIKNISKKKNNKGFLNAILVSSITAFTGAPATITYAMTKASLNTLAVGISKEIGLSKKIRVNAICPGATETDLTKKYSEQVSYDYMNKIAKKTFFEENGKPEYIANLISFLLSEESYWIQGQSIVIDGGETLY